MLLNVVLVLLISVVLFFSIPVFAAVDPAAARQELECIEDLRLLHWYAIEDIHDSKALAMYLVGWGGPNRTGEAESLMQEAEDVYGVLRSVDHGGMALQAEIDASAAPPAGQPANQPAFAGPSQAQFDLLQRARRSVAPQVTALCNTVKALKGDLTRQINEQAAQKAKWQVESKPEPWSELPVSYPLPIAATREADARLGFQRGIALAEPFFKMTDAEQDYALRKAAKTGINYANISCPAISNWAEIERVRGTYDFAALDTAIKRFAKYGIRVCPMLATFTGTSPQLMVDIDSAAPSNHQFTTTGKGKDGKVLNTGSGINLFNPPTGEAFGKFLAAYAAHLKEKWAAQADAVFVEAGQFEVEAPEDESSAMDAYWRKWSKGNTPWRTPEAILADPQPDEAAVVRAEMCREAWLLDYVRTVSAGLKKGWPELRVQTKTVNDDFHRLQAKVTGKARDLYALCQLTDNPGTGSTAPMSMEMLRSFGNGRWTWAWAMHSGSGATPAACYAEGPFHDLSRMTGGWFVGNMMRQNYPGSWFRYKDRQLGDFGIGSYMMSARRAQEVSPVVLNTAAAPAEIAILWSQASLRRSRTWQLCQSALAWGHMLTRTGIRYDYIPESGLTERLKPYKILILPNTQSMADSTCAAIGDWAKRGGIVLGFGAPGLYDEFGRRRTSLPLANVFGADLASMRVPGVITPDKLETTHSEGSFTFGNPPPRPYKFEANLTAALKPAGGTPRAWFSEEGKDVAIVENNIGQGKAMLCGFDVGFEYWESATYELTYGLTHSRHSNYNFEQKRYEAWTVKELDKLGIKRDLTLPVGNFLRAQRGDDPDWFHCFRNGPQYSEYMFEEERPVRTVTSWLRKRQGIDNLYIGLAHTEGNYYWDRGYLRCMLTGAEITASVATPGDAAVVFDARLRVPVPSAANDGRLEFRTWLPMAKSAAFAVAPAGKVRLFGDPKPTGIAPEQLAQAAATNDAGPAMADVEILEPARIAAFVSALKGTSIVIGCADARFKPAAQALADWLKQNYQIDSRITAEGPRGSCRFDYMDSFGWTGYPDDPVQAAVVIGNCQDNGLMWKFVKLSGNVRWLPLEVNQNFPGAGRSIVMLSSPVTTDGGGNITKKDTPQQLVIGASLPGEAMMGVKAFQNLR